MKAFFQKAMKNPIANVCISLVGIFSIFVILYFVAMFMY